MLWRRLHPHGVLTISAWATFASDGANFAEKFPGIDLHVGKPACSLASIHWCIMAWPANSRSAKLDRLVLTD